MSHSILTDALQFLAAPGLWGTTDGSPDLVKLLTVQQQLFNALAPVVPRIGNLDFTEAEPVYRVLMRADTFRFATSLHISGSMTTALAQEVLAKMDFVVDVALASSNVDDGLTPTLLALPHLERVTFLMRNDAMTYQGMLRPLLQHHHESVRLSAAASSTFKWFQDLPIHEIIAAIRDDFIPLIENARCSGVVPDLLNLLQSVAGRFIELSPEIVRSLGDRLFHFMTAANSHAKLIVKSLDIFAHLAYVTVRVIPVTNTLMVDVFQEWPVLELLPDWIRRGVVPTDDDSGVERIMNNIFAGPSSEKMPHHQQRVFDLQIPDLIFDRDLASCQGLSLYTSPTLEQIASADPLAFLTKTNVVHKYLHQFLIPLHRDVMAAMLVLRRRGVPFIGVSGELLVAFDTENFRERATGVRFIIYRLILSVLRQHQHRPDEKSQVLRLLFDEHVGFNIGPILQSYVLVARNENADGRGPTALLKLCVTEREKFIEARRHGRVATERCYLSDFLESLEELCKFGKQRYS